jgi:hypothetical protein
MKMTRQQSNRASVKETTEGSREDVNTNTNTSQDDFKPKVDLPGKVDSGPEPDVFKREIPPQH